MVAPKVTILIPTYRQAQLVQRAVHTALAQMYEPLEVIVCDDSRDDETKNLLRPILKKEPRLRYIQNIDRLGRVGNYRKALYEHASGVWALMLDGDDYLIDNRFIADAMTSIGENRERQIMFVQGGGEIRQWVGAAEACPSDCQYDQSIVLSTRLPAIKKQKPLKKTTQTPIFEIVSGTEYVRVFPRKRQFLHLSTLFHVATAKAIDFYRMDLLSSDLESFMRLALHGNVLLINRPVGVWLQHAHNAGQNASMDAIIQNSCWANEVKQYAIEHQLWSRSSALKWANQVRSREIIGAFSRETIRRKMQNKSRLKLIIFFLDFIKKHPNLMLHPVFIKKLIFSLLY